MFEEMFSMEKEKVTGRKKKKKASVRRVIPFTQLIIEKKTSNFGIIAESLGQKQK
jgi:hypothetical protein